MVGGMMMKQLLLVTLVVAGEGSRSISATELRGEARAVHERLLSLREDEQGEAACRERLTLLRRLASEKRLDEAFDLGHALKPEHRLKLASECSVDVVHSGVYEVQTMLGVPVEVTATSKAIETHFALMDANDRALEIQAGTFTHDVKKALIGLELDGKLLLPETTLRCVGDLCEGAGRSITVNKVNQMEVEAALRAREGDILREHGLEHASRMYAPVEDSGLFAAQFEHEFAVTSEGSQLSNYVLGEKKILLVPVCFSDTSCEESYNVGKIRDDHDGSTQSFFSVVAQNAADYFEQSSFGQFSITTTVADYVIMEDLPFDACETLTPLSWGLNNDGYDKRALDGALLQGLDIADFDFHVTVIPWCAAFGWAGVGWVGYPGSTLNLLARDHDATYFVHELGHNLGSHHAAYDDSDYKGSRLVEPRGDHWNEYGNPFSVMGQGRTTDGEAYAHFMAGPMDIFGWIPQELLHTFTLGEEGMKETIALQPIDTGSFDVDSTAYLAAKIPTDIPDVFFWVEHRTISTGESAIILSYNTGISRGTPRYGGSGYYMGQTVLVDSKPDTDDWYDSALTEGTTRQIDIAADDSYTKFLYVYFVAAGSLGNAALQVSDVEFQAIPTHKPTKRKGRGTVRPTWRSRAKPTRRPYKQNGDGFNGNGVGFSPTAAPSPNPTLTSAPSLSPAASPSRSPVAEPSDDEEESDKSNKKGSKKKKKCKKKKKTKKCKKKKKKKKK